MRRFEVKRGHYKNIEGDKLEEIMKEVFSDVKIDEGRLIAKFGAMKSISVEPEGKKALLIEIDTDVTADPEKAAETIRARNEFLDRATGFSSKQRAKRMKKAGSKDKSKS